MPKEIDNNLDQNREKDPKILKWHPRYLKLVKDRPIVDDTKVDSLTAEVIQIIRWLK